MPYLEPLPEWQSPGVEPPGDLKTNGWKHTQRPPASYFDWFFFTVYYALLELQQNAIHKEKIYDGVNSSDATLVATAKAVKQAYDLATNNLTTAKAYTDTKIASLVDSSPQALDTLKELADALGNDPNFATTVSNLIGTKIALTEKGAADGVATLDANKKVLASQLATATTAIAGIVQLVDSATSTSTTQAPTANALKVVNDALVNHKNDNVVHITSSERTTWNAKETTEGAQTKATQALNDAKAYADARVLRGSGTPEGNVGAPVGTMYLNTGGGVGTTLYVKETGSGNTGWVAK